MKRPIVAFLLLVVLGLSCTFVASAVFSTQSVANGGDGVKSDKGD